MPSRGVYVHETSRKPSERFNSILSVVNFARIDFVVPPKRKLGRASRRAIKVTISEGGMPGRIVRIQEPKTRYTRSGYESERY